MAKPRWMSERQPDKCNPSVMTRERQSSPQILGRLRKPNWVRTIAKLPLLAALSLWALVRELKRLGLPFPRMLSPRRLLRHRRQ